MLKIVELWRMLLEASLCPCAVTVACALSLEIETVKVVVRLSLVPYTLTITAIDAARGALAHILSASVADTCPLIRRHSCS